MIHFVRFDNDFPGGTPALRLDDESAFDHVGSVAVSMLQHGPELDLAEIPVFHSFLEMRGELDLPVLPLGQVHCVTVSCPDLVPTAPIDAKGLRGSDGTYFSVRNSASE